MKFSKDFIYFNSHLLNQSSTICKNFLFFSKNQNEKAYKQHLLKSKSLCGFFNDFTNFKKLFTDRKFKSQFEILIKKSIKVMTNFYNTFKYDFLIEKKFSPISRKASSKKLELIKKPNFSNDRINSIQEINDKENIEIPKDVFITFTDLNNTARPSNSKSLLDRIQENKISKGNHITSNVFDQDSKYVSHFDYKIENNVFQKKRSTNPLNVIIPTMKHESKETSKSTNTNSNNNNFFSNKNNFPNNIFSSKNNNNSLNVSSNLNKISGKITTQNFLSRVSPVKPKRESIRYYIKDLELKKNSSPVSQKTINTSLKISHSHISRKKFQNSSIRSISHRRSNSSNKAIDFSEIQKSSNRISLSRDNNQKNFKMFDRIKQMIIFSQPNKKKLDKFSLNQFKK